MADRKYQHFPNTGLILLYGKRVFFKENADKVASCIADNPPCRLDEMIPVLLFSPSASVPPRPNTTSNSCVFWSCSVVAVGLAGCIVSLMTAITSVACTKSEEDVATIIGLIGAILGKM